ncbi:MAG: hypothetical protein J1F11_11450 [Oscillospiraceae bacterium]|nr:hypothetical protein [Oscillospiraceae bacterium]
MKKILSVFIVLVMTLSLMTVSVSAASPKLNASSVDLPIGYTVTVKVSGNSGDVKWSSADSTVAAIKSSKGSTAKISGKKTGSTYIYAKTDGKTLKCRITVKQSFITASSGAIEIDKGGSKTITFTVKGSKDIAVSRSDKSVCSIAWGKWDGDKIKLTVKGNSAGTCDINVCAKGYSESTAEVITVNVTDPDSSKESKSSSMTDEVIELVNKERKNAGRSELISDDTLNEIAQMRANELTQKFSHTRPDGSSCFTAFDEAGVVNMAAAENIAAGQKNSKEVMNSWMNSPGHKSNILNSSYTKIGVGCVKSGGKYYWVQVFSD